MAETAPLPQNVEQPQPFEVSPPRIVGDFRSEVLSRVANFRKHQERWERDPQDCSAETLAKPRASLGVTLPRQPSGK